MQRSGAGDDGVATLHGLLAAFAPRGGDPAIVALNAGGDIADTLDYAALYDHIVRFAGGLRDSGLTDGALVLLWAPNSPSWVTTYLGVVAAGNIVIPLDDQSTAAGLRVVVGRSAPRCIVTVTGHLDALREAGISATPVFLLDVAAEDARSWRQLLSRTMRPPPTDDRQVAALLYTSGTTGTPKGVPLTHANLMSNVRALLDARIVSSRDRVLLPLPLHHAYPATVGMLTVLACGGAIVLPSGVTGPELTVAANRAGATILIGVPRLYEAMLESILKGIRARGPAVRAWFQLMQRFAAVLRRRTGINVGRLAFRSLHRRIGRSLRILASGGARLDAGIANQLEGMGWLVLSGYGLTETSPVVTFNTPERRRIESEGCAIADVELRITATPNESHGEILVRGANVFSGYWQDEAATRQAFTGDGWFRTGDLGFIDDEGFLHVLGRGSEVIVLSDGKKIAPEELEREYASPYIREVALLEQQGLLFALVVPDEDAIRSRGTMSEQSLLRDELDTVLSSLPPYQRVREFRLLRHSLPRTRLGKLRRHLLPELFAQTSMTPRVPLTSEMDQEDRRLLASERVRRVWEWLAARYSATNPTLDSSPQLDLGVDSLSWVSLTAEIDDRFGVSLSGEQLSRVLTVRDLLRAIDASQVTHGAGSTSDTGEKYLELPGVALGLLGRLIIVLVRLIMRGPFRLRVTGRQNLPTDGSFVIAPNHTSYLDPLAVAAALPSSLLDRTCWAGWAGKTHKGPVWRTISRALRVFPVNPDQDLGQAIRLGAQVIQAGDVLVWFPEGRRSRDGVLQPFRRGIGALLEQVPVPVVPVRIEGAFAAWPSQRRWPRFRPLTVAFAAPRTADWLSRHGTGDDKAACISNGLEKCMSVPRCGQVCG
jgi:long-chain acyl-CoA synthetase